MSQSSVSKSLAQARQKCLSEDEAYWRASYDFAGGPISPRNEAAALSWLLDHQSLVCRGGQADVDELQALCGSYCGRLGFVVPPEERSDGEQAAGGPAGGGAGGQEAMVAAPVASAPSPETSTSGRTFEEASAEAALLRWCQGKGLRGAALPACFPTAAGPLRGLMAGGHVVAGDVVLEVPQDLLISYDTAKSSDLGKVLCALPLGLDDDSIALIWTCVERREPEAEAAPFWASLPQRFATLLSAPESDLELLAGTPLYGEAVHARKHLREAFDASAPAFASLVQAYPTYFQPDWFSFESYLWAAELWYSYGIQVQFKDGAIRTCLAPFLGLMNHHALPHVVHFSKVDPASGCIRVRAFRPCAPNRQLFLSYGPYPNSKLLLFYGFALTHNPFDCVDVTLPAPTDAHASDRNALLSAAGLGLEHKLRGAAAAASGGGSSSINSRLCLAPALLATARVLAATPEQLRALKGLPSMELKKRLAVPLQPTAAEGAAAGGGGSGGAGGGAAGQGGAPLGGDAVALALVAGVVGELERAVEASAGRLREAGAGGSEQGGVSGAEGGEAGCSSRSVRHFAAVYVAGVKRILSDTMGLLG